MPFHRDTFRLASGQSRPRHVTRAALGNDELIVTATSLPIDLASISKISTCRPRTRLRRLLGEATSLLHPKPDDNEAAAHAKIGSEAANRWSVSNFPFDAILDLRKYLNHGTHHLGIPARRHRRSRRCPRSVDRPNQCVLRREREDHSTVTGRG